MTLSNPNSVVTEQRLHDFYTEILPYLGRVDAGYTPVGSVIIMSGNEAPTNYLACDGTVYNIADYPELAAFYARSQGSCNFYGGNGTTTFAVPDWRGEFIRGAGTNSRTNQGSGAAVGRHQDATAIPTFWNTTGQTMGYRCNSSGDINIANPDKAYGTSDKWGACAKGDSGTQSVTEALKSVRPTNTSVLFCVAVKNIYLNPSLDYSTEEKVVGSWIDGKPLYQKTIVETMPDATTLGTVVDKPISIGVAVDTFVNAQMMLVSVDSSNSYYIPLNNHITCALQSGSINEIFKTIMVNNDSSEARKNKLHIRNGLPGWNGETIYITIQYTKTTD